MGHPPTTSIILAVCLGLGVARAEVSVTLERYLDYPNEQMFFSTENVNRNSSELKGLPFALCQTSKASATATFLTEMQCKLMVFRRGAPEKVCDVSLRTSIAENHRIGSFIKLVSFADEKAALLWFEESINPRIGIFRGRIRCDVVDLRSCESKEVVLLEDKFDAPNTLAYSVVVPYEDSFDVIIGFPTSEWHKFSVDLDGQITDDRKEWARTGHWMSQFTSVAPNSRSMGYLRFNEEVSFNYAQTFKNNKVLLVKADGSEKQLIGKTPTSRRGASTAHQTIGIALLVAEKSANVYRFDQAGKPKAKVLTVDFDYAPANLQMHNLADGGFLLLTVKNLEDKFYIVARFDAEGKRTGQLEFTGPRDNSQFRSYYTESLAFQDNPAGGYCLASVISPSETGQLRGDSHFDSLVKCFGDADFAAVQ